MVLSFIQEVFRPKDKMIPIVPKSDIKEIKKLIMDKSDNPLAILPGDRLIIEEIKSETERRNINNITRTKAYLDFYQRHPEIEWSFLAHMVSRNGGYHMTDLKGEILPSFLEEEERKNFFLFLEKANAFIFHDAFPQLLLYQKSVERKSSLFHLLPAFGVSKTMPIFWERFWKGGDKKEITLALIINEQSMLQERLVARITEDYSFEKLLFFLQDRLEFTTVFFPYKKRKKSRNPYSLAGTSISHFESTKKRIEIGKRLYGILFMNEAVYQSSMDYAKKTPHAASRSDYWPEYYSADKYEPHKIFSPELGKAWSDKVHTFSSADWANARTVHRFDTLETLPLTRQPDVTAQAKLIVKLAAEFNSFSI
ncbi:DUF2515 family protein [Bacillus salacetis]|uniref:DUF2515 family protein n=1 Tax=Bacillus salacetis TaxID=2315464 RepID=UPI003B9F20AB